MKDHRGALAGLVVWAALCFAPPAAPATFVVNRSDDPTPTSPITSACTGGAASCSLREAILRANTDAAADVITFAASTNGVPITLTRVNAGGVNEDLCATGDLDVTQSLTITGNGSASTIIQAGTNATNGIDKVFAINPFCDHAVSFTITGVTIRYGRNTQPNPSADFSFTGGGMDFCGNGASTLTMQNVVLTDNTNVNGYGGGLNIDEVAPAAGVVSIQNTTIQNNTAVSTGGGMNVFGDDVQVTITGSTIQNNTTLGTGGVGASGGGMNVRITHTTASPVPFVTIDSTTIAGNTARGWGGGIAITGSGNQNITIQNGSSITGNTVDAQAAVSSEGGGIYVSANAARTNTITNTTISGNHSDVVGSGASPENPEGGGILVDAGTLTLGAGVVVSNNTAKDGAGIFVRTASATLAATGTSITGNAATGRGGGVGVGGFGGTATVNGARITGNSAGVSGGALFVAGGTLSADRSRVASNTAPAASGAFVSGGTAAITNDWWACSSDPTAGGTPCNSVSGASANPWLRVLLTPGSSTLATNQTTSLTASVNTNSAGTNVTGTVGVLLGLPVAWSASLGAISGSQTTIQPAGTATATFTATGVGAASAAAVVDSDANSGARSNVAAITVNKASTTVSLTGQGAATTVTGQAFTVSYSGTGAFGNSPTAPTGNVTVSDGVNSCTATIAAGSCTITLFTAGSRTLTATYPGDANFAASPASAGLSHTVNKADTTAAITSDAPDPSNAGQVVPVTYSVAVTAPGSGTPSGSVQVSDGTLTCTGTVAAGTCNLTFTVAGPHTLTATYLGDASYNASPISAGASHQVNPGPATHVVVGAPASVTAGSAFTIALTMKDAFENTATGYTGTVHFTKTDAGAGSSLPADDTFTGADAGVHTFTNGATLVTAGSQTIAATDTVTSTITGSSPVAVSPAAASLLSVTAPAAASVGVPFSVGVTAKDAYGNTATSYLGTVLFTSSDPLAALPANYTFVGADSGVHVFGATLTTVGGQTITATDTLTASITGTSGAVSVTCAGADTNPPTVTAPAAVVVGQSLCCGTFGGASGDTSAALASFLAGGSATDDCTVSPTRLAPQVAGVDVTGATCFHAGATTVTFRFQDAASHVGTAASTATVRMFGDLNLDATIDPSDIVILRAYFNFVVSPGTPPFNAPLLMADLTHDSVVDPSDLVVMRAYFNFVVGCLAP